ncbi:MAG: winged helix-turn-helix transcriptional regulator [Defluviitaleaceae bacterium]|nr:winged helix-turn-helix transcriptional regulator [Defluviitaleaceae bacterium]
MNKDPFKYIDKATWEHILCKANLTLNEKKIIKIYYLSDEKNTINEIAEQLNYSVSHVNKALKNLRNEIILYLIIEKKRK